MNLYVIRHAIAEEEHPSGEDSQRALTEKGRKKMRQIAKGLRILGSEFDVILTSPYIRAQETAQILADVFKMKKQVVVSENLTPISTPDALISEINEKYSVDSIAIVGHEPYLTTFISQLVANGAPLDIDLKKGGICRLSTDDLHHSHHGTLEWLFSPGVLVEISEK